MMMPFYITKFSSTYIISLGNNPIITTMSFTNKKASARKRLVNIFAPILKKARQNECVGKMSLARDALQRLDATYRKRGNARSAPSRSNGSISAAEVIALAFDALCCFCFRNSVLSSLLLLGKCPFFLFLSHVFGAFAGQQFKRENAPSG